MTGNALILGANGRFGRHAAEAFWNRGWRVTLFDRDTDTLEESARGMDVIVNGWNPLYPDWADDLPRLTTQVIAAARSSGATVILPGNVYVYGAGSDPHLSPETPHAAQNPLGRIRIEMEEAYRASGVPTILLRAGDFLDTEVSGNWFDKVIVAGADRGRISYPGDPDAPHAWAYLPDLAKTAVLLAERRNELETFADIAFPGYTLTGHQLSDLVAEALDRPQALRRMNWLPVQLARPFWPMARHLLEMRYLWSMPHRLDGARLEALVPEYPETPAIEAIALAVRHKIRPNKPVARPQIHVPMP
jgi:nucleoside-diphosphate-sugar epimerase